MPIHLSPHWRKQALLGGFVLLLVVSYWRMDTSSGLPATLLPIRVPLIGAPSHPASLSPAASTQDAATKDLITVFMGALFTHNAHTYATQLALVPAWTDSTAVHVVRREFALEGMMAYYLRHDASQRNRVDSVQVIAQGAGHFAARVFTHTQVFEAGRPRHNYPLVALLTLKTIPVSAANPYGRYITSFRFTHPANYPVLDTRFR